MAGKGEKPGKLYYSMGEVSEMLDVNPSLVRFWEQKFDIIKPKKNKKGNRMFTPEDVRNLKIIYHLVKERGMTLAGAEKYMKASRGNIERDMELAERLQSIRSVLLEVRQQLGADGPLVDDETEEPAAAQENETANSAGKIGATEGITDEIPFEEAIEEMNSEPEEMLDFCPEPVFETEDEQQKEDESGEPQKSLYIEQTLF